MGFFKEPDVANRGEEPFLINRDFYRQASPTASQIAKPNFSRTELAQVSIPHQIVKEIRAEKFRLFNIMFLNFIFFVVGIFFTLVYFCAPIKDGAQLKIPLEYIPHPAFSITMLLVGLIFGLIALIDQFNLRIDLRSYKTDLLMKIEKIPYFLIKNYKSLLVRPIYVNWLAAFTYLAVGITIGVFYLIRLATKNPTKLNTELIIMFCLLGVMFFLQVLTLIQTYARRGRITSFYGYEIVAFDEAKTLKKNANRRCLVLFLLLLTLLLFAIVIPYFILRRSKRKRLVPSF